MSEEEKPKPRTWKIYDRHGKFDIEGPDGHHYQVRSRATAFRIARERGELILNEDGWTYHAKMSHEEALELVRLDKVRYKGGGVQMPGQVRADHRAEIARKKGTDE
jgi:hypothetical protein